MITLLVLLASLLSIWYVYRKLQPKSATPVPPGQTHIPDTMEFRVAIHEAGHAVTAWWCTAIHKISRITVEDPNGGHVAMFFYNPKTKDTLWCDLVITLSGVVAETIIYSSVRSGPASKDLMMARDLAGQLIKMGAYDAPWSIKNSPSLPFEKIYKQPLSEMERAILRQGYQFSKEFLQKRLGDHHRLVVQLLKARTMKEEELSQLFGDRAFIRISRLFNSTFIQPRS